MAFQIVVTNSLTNEMISAGERLTRFLDESRFPFKASFWYYISESGTWRLIIATPVVATDGPLKAYETVQTLISKMPEDQPKIRLEDIAVVEPHNQLVSLLRTAIKTGRGISGIRFSQNVINGVLIDDSYLYRVA